MHGRMAGKCARKCQAVQTESSQSLQRPTSTDCGGSLAAHGGGVVPQERHQGIVQEYNAEFVVFDSEMVQRFEHQQHLRHSTMHMHAKTQTRGSTYLKQQEAEDTANPIFHTASQTFSGGVLSIGKLGLSPTDFCTGNHAYKCIYKYKHMTSTDKHMHTGIRKYKYTQRHTKIKNKGTEIDTFL